MKAHKIRCIDTLRIWKDETGHTMREMARRAGTSSSHICRVIHGKKTLSEEKLKRIKEVRRMEQIIRCEPADVALVKYELECFINAY